MTSSTGRPSVRDRILATATRLFQAEGIHVVGIDRIIAEAGVAKQSLYNHFATKADLVVAYLEGRDREVLAHFDDQSARLIEEEGLGPLDAFFDAFAAWLHAEDFRGCSFINTTVEVAETAPEASAIATRHKLAVHERLTQAAVASHGKGALAVGPALGLLMEGAIVAKQLGLPGDSAETARRAAQRLASHSATR